MYLCSEDGVRYPGKPELSTLDSNLCGTGALNRLYEAADGWVFLCCPTDAEWLRLCAALDRSDWTEDFRFRSAVARDRFDDQLIAEISTVLANRSGHEWEKLAADYDIACVRADTSGGDDFLLQHPQSTSNGFVVEDTHPGVGTYRRAGCAATFSRTPGAAHIAHQFGQDGPAILTELGYEEAVIREWLASGLLVARPPD